MTEKTGNQKKQKISPETERSPETEKDDNTCCAEGVGDAGERESGKEAECDCSCDKASDKAEPEDGEVKEAERYMRLMAEFQNYKKRVAKEKRDIHAYANENLVTELLEVLDNFERGLEHDSTGDPEGYARGMELIFTQMKDVLTGAGLSEIKALGEDFDPNMHNAVMTEEVEEFESGKVSKVMQKGYSLNNKVIRPAMVAVSK